MIGTNRLPDIHLPDNDQQLESGNDTSDAADRNASEQDLGGRPRHEATEENRARISHMAGLGMPQKQIAHRLHMDPKTLRKYYREELTMAAIDTNLQVAETLYSKAIAGDTFACMFWLRTRAGFKFNQPALTPTDRPWPSLTPKTPPRPPTPPALLPCPIPVVRNSKGEIVE